MRIGVDVDDVLNNLGLAFVEFHNSRYGTSFSLEHFHTYDWSVVLGEPYEVVSKKADEFFESDFFDAMSPPEDCKEAALNLSLSHDLVAVTSRWGKAAETTNDWLEEHFPELFSNVCFSKNNNPEVHQAGHRSKADICLAEGCEVIIEDCFEYAAECAAKGIVVLLIDKPWNQRPEPERVIRVYSWAEIPGLIEQLRGMPRDPQGA